MFIGQILELIKNVNLNTSIDHNIDIASTSFLSKCKQAWKQNFSFRSALIILGIYLFLALFTPFIAHKSPLYCTYKGKVYFPAFQTKITIDGNPRASDQIEWKKLELNSAIWPLIPYGIKFDINHKEISPMGTQITRDGTKLSLRQRHWLGTSKKGIDILAVIVKGSQRALSLGIFVVLIASLLGIIFGGLAGYFQDHGLMIKRVNMCFLVPAGLLAWFYGIYIRRYQFSLDESSWSGLLGEGAISLLIMVLIVGGFMGLGNKFSFGPYLNTRIPIKLDSLISRLMELIQTIPILLLIITLSAFFKSQNVYFIMFIIALFSWIGIARVVRGEILSIKERGFISAGKAMGIPPLHIIIRHILPNSLAAVWPLMAFSIGYVIITEATLSFLSLIENSDASWGGLLTEGRSIRQSWWIALFPGICIFLAVYAFNMVGEKLRDLLDPRSH